MTMKIFRNTEKIIFSLVIALGFVYLLQSWFSSSGEINYYNLGFKILILGAVIYWMFKRNWPGHIVVVVYIAGGFLFSIYAIYLSWIIYEAGTIFSYDQIVSLILVFLQLLISSIALAVMLFYLRYIWRMREIQNLTDSDLVKEYTSAARLWEQRLESNDSTVIKKGEEAFDRTWLLFKEAKRRDSSLSLLVPLLRDGNDAIRMLAARQLFGHVANEPQRVLEEIAKKQTDLGRGARETLEALQAGKLEVA